MKAPDIMVRVTAGSDVVWFTGDLLSNTTVEDTKAPLRWIFTLLGGGPGFRFNPVPTMVYIKDKGAWKASVRAAMAAHPPTQIVPAHGVVFKDDPAARAAAILS
jgi:glyoxylase-like metal-dependent hydrolase (beta-lactamase superfamily II)